MGGTQKTEWISDNWDRLVYAAQGWGELGIDLSAHDPAQTPLKLQIGRQHYAKGLGHHAPGNLVVDLGGRYLAFDAEVGVQQQNSTQGSVVFRVFVDGKQAFDSGVMRQSTPAKVVHVSVSGAQELRLEAGDAGDGIMCDCADWAEARLTLSPNAKPEKREWFDIAPYGEVCTWDASRMDGARAGRIEEFHAEDLYLDQRLKPEGDGVYLLPASGCIGLTWFEQRRFQRLTIEVGIGLVAPEAAGVHVEAWMGTYPFQGDWRTLAGVVKVKGHSLTFDLDNKEALGSGVRKVRWVLQRGLRADLGSQVEVPAHRGNSLHAVLQGLFTDPRSHAGVRLSVLNRSQMQAVEVKLVADQGVAAQIDVSAYNATMTPQTWRTSKPLPLSLRCPRLSHWDASAAQPMLRFTTSRGGFSVALSDVLANGCVYVKDLGVFVSGGPKGKTLAAYKLSIAKQQTVLDRVRKMPEQTFAGAMKRTHNPVQDHGPTLLGLGPNNWKWLVQEDGEVHWKGGPEAPDREMPFAERKYAFRPRLNGMALSAIVGPAGLRDGIERWMPGVRCQVVAKGASCEYRAFVTPEQGRGLFLASFRFTGGPIAFELPFFRDRNVGAAARIEMESGRALVMDGDKLLAVVALAGLGPLRATSSDGVLRVGGSGAGELVVAIPGWEARADEPGLASIQAKPAAKASAAYWHNAAAQGMHVAIPDKLLQDVIASSQMRCLVDTRSDGERLAPWIAQIHYGPLESEANTIIRGMALMGRREFAEKSLDYFIHLYNPQGFLTTGYTLLGTGWHLWTLGECLALSPDPEWFTPRADEVARVCRWVVSQRRATMKLDALGRKPPQYGLIPPGVIADWNAYQYYFYSNGMFCAGLESAGRALKAIGHPDADGFISEARTYKSDILRAYRWTQARTPVVPLQDGTWVPGFPSQVNCPGPLARFFPGDDGSRSWCYDVEIGAHNLIQQGILPADGSDARQIANHMEDEMFLASGWFDYPADRNHEHWFDLGGFAKVQPYYARLSEVYAMRDDVKPFIRSYFNALAAMLNQRNLTLWEHFHNSGAPDKTHETGVFLQQTRFMFVKERGDELWLAPFVTSNWMKDGMVVEVKRAPTFFGEAGFRIVSHAREGYIEATIDPPTRIAPKAIVIRLRHPEGLSMKAVQVNGTAWHDFDPKRETVRLDSHALAPGGRITIRVGY